MSDRKPKKKFYAILIGIDFYLPDPLSGESKYENLGGCVNDVNDMESFLKNKFKLEDQNITKLTSSDINTSEPAEIESQRASYKNIITAFDDLNARVEQGDHVFIHYSGHGGKAKTIFPNEKGSQSYDETLIPYDFILSESNCILDVEFSFLLNCLIEKEAIVTVILDSCHSGGMSRTFGHAKVRSVGSLDIPPKPTEKLITSKHDLDKYLYNNTIKGITNSASWIPETSGYTLIAACRSNENAYENSFGETNSRRNGVLTYWLLRSLENLTQNISYSMLHYRILAQVKDQYEKQTPILQGEGERKLFELDELSALKSINVLKINQSNSEITIAAGQVHGIGLSTQLFIFPNNCTDLHNENNKLATIEITELEPTKAVGKIIDLSTKQAITPGDQAIIISPSPIQMRKKVKIICRPSSCDKHKKSIHKLEKKIMDSHWLDLVNDKESYLVSIDNEGYYKIHDASGEEINFNVKNIHIDQTDAEKIIKERLEQTFKFNTIKKLNNTSDHSLKNRLVIELETPNNSNITRKLEDTIDINDGDKITLKIKNKSPYPINITIINLQSDWGISQTWPMDSDSFITLEPEDDENFPMEMYLPEKYIEGIETLKIFATKEPTNFHWLAMSPLDCPASEKHSKRNKPTTPLEKLIYLINTSENRKRSFSITPPLDSTWATKQIDFFIKSF